MTDFAALLRALANGQVEVIIVGGLAATFHGSSRLTQAVDVVYARSDTNLNRVSMALGPFEPYLRGAPRGLPFDCSADTLKRGLNFTLTTALGDIDLLGEITGGGGYHALLPHSIKVNLFGLTARALDLPTLIRTKRAAGQPRDLEVIAELEALAEESEPQD